MSKIKIMRGFQKDFYAIVKLDGKILDLTGYTAKFIMVSSGGGWVKIDADAEISNATAGEVKYEPTETDVDTEGDYKAYFALSIGGVKKIAAPTDTFDVEIVSDLK